MCEGKNRNRAIRMTTKLRKDAHRNWIRIFNSNAYRKWGKNAPWKWSTSEDNGDHRHPKHKIDRKGR